MPRRKTQKRRMTRRRKFPTRRTNLQGLVSGFPKTRRVAMRYVTSKELTSSSGTLVNHNFRANGTFDPDVSGIGHQPMGFDIWTPLYNHMIVLSSKISVKVLTRGGQTSIAGIFLNDDSVMPYTTFEGYLEAKRGVQQTITPGFPNRMSTTFSAKRFFNVTDLKDNFGRLGSNVGLNPTEQAVFSVYYQDLTGATNTCTFITTIDYIVEYSEPKDQLQS